ncbi:hypothetical protein SAMN04515671_0646 [Nakamurella panacisegetis]|uniref:Uncharacterized protein n=1 Tax=Nakamurella panacisegetis TaxID=1090615 RepID=A0A1H0IV03_9ACTN|nr:hypothetical protein SAMN04515671_0646 [Nakamurella panacisegetis]
MAYGCFLVRLAKRRIANLSTRHWLGITAWVLTATLGLIGSLRGSASDDGASTASSKSTVSTGARSSVSSPPARATTSGKNTAGKTSTKAVVSSRSDRTPSVGQCLSKSSYEIATASTNSYYSFPAPVSCASKSSLIQVALVGSYASMTKQCKSDGRNWVETTSTYVCFKIVYRVGQCVPVWRTPHDPLSATAYLSLAGPCPMKFPAEIDRPADVARDWVKGALKIVKVGRNLHIISCSTGQRGFTNDEKIGICGQVL